MLIKSCAEQRLRFKHEQTRRRDAGEPAYELDERFLSALAEGLPPVSGIALGFERLLLALLGEREIAQVVAFADAEL